MKYLDFAHGEEQKQERVFVLEDGSLSMKNPDFPPTRIHGAQESAVRLLDKMLELGLENWLGLGVFHASADLLCPLVPLPSGESQLREAIWSIETAPYTNIHAGLQLAWNGLCQPIDEVEQPKRRRRLFGGRRRPEATVEVGRRVLLLSDGDQNLGPPAGKIARAMKADGIEIDVIGIGGKPSDVNENLLKAIASPDSRGRPRYVFIRDTESLIEAFEERAVNIRRREDL